jgi:predicted ABC-class ATPase
MISMLVVRLTFNIKVLKMEHVFQMGYKEGDKVFYVSTTNWQGEETLVNSYEEGWDCH